MNRDDLLRAIGDYFDVVPRATSRVETIGGLTVFGPSEVNPFAGQPDVKRQDTITADHVRLAIKRMRELELPVEFEWIDDTAPDLSTAVEAAGLRIARHPLMVLDGEPRSGESEGALVRLVPADDVEPFMAARQATDIGFGAGGTHIGDDPEPGPSDRGQHALELARRGLLVQFGAFDTATGAALGGGAHVPRPETGVSEVTGIGVRPSARRRGIGTALAGAMAAHARSTGIETVFLSAESDAVAAIYQRAGFRRIGTACAAEVSSEEIA